MSTERPRARGHDESQEPRDLAVLRTVLVLISPAPAVRYAVAVTRPETTFTIVLDRGEDIGQNFGTLFEVRSTEGRPLLGAGFLGAYNTFDRADRHVLHVFERSEAPATFEALPRVNGDAGVYLFGRGGRLYARSAADGEDSAIRVFNEATKGWDMAEGVSPDATAVADGLLEVGEREVRYKDRTLLQMAGGPGDVWAAPTTPGAGSCSGTTSTATTPGPSDSSPGRGGPGRPIGSRRRGRSRCQLGKKGEFPYAMGQLRDDLLVTTNQGGVYRLRSDRWEPLRLPDGKSHQVYAALNMGEASGWATIRAAR